MKTSLLSALAGAGAMILLAGCQTGGGPGVGNYYECDRGTRLWVDFGGSGASARVNGGQRIFLRQTPSLGGGIYEGRHGERLTRMGGQVTWNSAARSAPEQCRQIVMPR